MASPFLQGFQVGANIASDKANRALRMQELQSQQQMRMLQEQNLAQQLAIRMEERDRVIQYRADMTKAIFKAQEASRPTIEVPNWDGTPIQIDNPNPMTQDQAAMTFIEPVIGKFEPEKIPAFRQAVALREARTEVNKARVGQIDASTRLTEARIKELEEGTKGTDPEFIKTIKALAERGINYSNDELKNMYDIKMGILPKAGTVTIPSEAKFIDEHIDKVMEQRAIEEEVTPRNLFGMKGEPTITRRRPKSRDEAKAYLRKEYQDLYGRATQQPASPAAAVQPEMQPSTIQPEAAPQFRKGQRVIQNGVTYEFDGSKWNAVK